VIVADDPSEGHQAVADKVAENDRDEPHPEPQGSEKSTRPYFGEGDGDPGPEQEKVHAGEISVGGGGGCYVHADSRLGEEGLSIRTLLEQFLDLVVVAHKRHVKIVRPVLKDETQRKVGATLEQLLAQFSDAESAVDMRPSEAFRQIAQCEQALRSFVLGQLP
jgi:hypothetical protein